MQYLEHVIKTIQSFINVTCFKQRVGLIITSTYAETSSLRNRRVLRDGLFKSTTGMYHVEKGTVLKIKSTDLFRQNITTYTINVTLVRLHVSVLS